MNICKPNNIFQYRFLAKATFCKDGSSMPALWYLVSHCEFTANCFSQLGKIKVVKLFVRP